MIISIVIQDFYCYRPPPIYEDFDACDSDVDYDSEDSNAENYYTNDYPEEEDLDDDEYVKSVQEVRYNSNFQNFLKFLNII